MRGALSIFCFSAVDPGDVIFFSSPSLLTFFGRWDLLCAEFATGLLLETYPNASKGLRHRKQANFGRGGSGPSGSATAPQLGFKVDQCSGKSRQVSVSLRKCGAIGLTAGEPPLDGKEKFGKREIRKNAQGSRVDQGGGGSKWPQGRGFGEMRRFWF